MPKYNYTAMNAFSKKVKGQKQALSEADLQEQLKNEDLYLLSCQEEKKKRKVKALKPLELSEFCRELGTLLSSGVTMVRAFAIMTEEEGIKPHQRELYQTISTMIRQGIPLSETMESMGEIFPPLLINMIHTAEVSGNMDKVCSRMAVQYDKDYRLNAKINGAMVYPKILVTILIGVLVLLMAYVIPQFEDLFSQMDTLPAATRLLLALSDLVRNYWILLLAGLAVLFLTFRILSHMPGIRLQLDHLRIVVPVVGKLNKTVYTARFARTLSSLYASGLPIIACLTITRKTIGNCYIESQFDDLIAFVRGGGTLSDALERVDGFNRKMVSTIRIGEETGHLDFMLEAMSNTLDYEAEVAATKMVSYLEPAMIVIMALIVGFVMIAVIQPIYGSYQAISIQE